MAAMRTISASRLMTTEGEPGISRILSCAMTRLDSRLQVDQPSYSVLARAARALWRMIIPSGEAL